MEILALNKQSSAGGGAIDIVFYDASAGTQTYPTSYEWGPAGGSPINISAFLPRVDPGDRIYFLMQNSAAPGSGSSILHRWDQTIWATRFIQAGTVIMML